MSPILIGLAATLGFRLARRLQDRLESLGRRNQNASLSGAARILDLAIGIARPLVLEQFGVQYPGLQGTEQFEQRHVMAARFTRERMREQGYRIGMGDSFQVVQDAYREVQRERTEGKLEMERFGETLDGVPLLRPVPGPARGADS